MTMSGIVIRTLIGVVILATVTHAQHSHHMKRQGGGGGSQAPQLHLEVGSDKVFSNSPNLHASIPEYHMSQSDNIVFNFTCNIKNPSHKYKLTMTKEQILSDGTRAPPENLIDPDNIENVSPEIRRKFSSRYSIDYVEVEPRALRISLIIKSMKLEDNGLYACKYSNISKSIIAHVYKSPQMEDIKFGEEHKKPVEKLDLKLGTPVKLVCSVNDVYPKPKVSFLHTGTGHQLSNKDYIEKSQPIDKTRYLFSVTSIYTVNPSYSHNEKNLKCEVKTDANKTLTKQIKLHVTGSQLIDTDCRETQGANPNSPDTHKVECQFFANPKYTVVYFETMRDNVTEEEIQQYNKHQAELAATAATAAAVAAAVQTGGGSNPTGFKPPQKGGINPNTVAPSTTAPPNIMVRITESQPTDNYALTIEPVPDTPGLFKAVLKINQLRDQDFKNFTFRADKLQREIKLVRGLRDMALSGQENHAVHTTPHSAARILLLVSTTLLATTLLKVIF